MSGSKIIPYGRQQIDEADVAAVMEVLRSDWLTTGPKVAEFEEAFAHFVGTAAAVAVSSGTAALHAAMYAVDLGPGDEVIVPPITFAATANAVVFQGGRPVFADVDAEALLIDPQQVESKITSRTKAIIAVDFAGQACDYELLRALADRHGLRLVADACHSLGGLYKGRPVGSLADLNIFSLHPVKAITTGEGGVITTNDQKLAQKMRMFRNHGISTDRQQRDARGAWFYEMVDLGFNYRLTDFQCALGLSQLKKLPEWIARRQALARRYGQALAKVPGVKPLGLRPAAAHAYHLYVVRVDSRKPGKDRDAVFRSLQAAGVKCQVHYIPVHLHPFYRQRFATGPGLCPVAEKAYEQILSLPIYPGLTEKDQDYVVASLQKALT
jgi:perosamine synthetase